MRITREKSLPAGERDPQDDLRRDTLNTHQLLRADAIAIGYRRSRRVPVLASQCRASEQEAESQRVASNTNARRAKAREVREPNAVYWGCSTKMGADPDPFIRSQILRDASGFFGGLD